MKQLTTYLLTLWILVIVLIGPSCIIFMGDIMPDTFIYFSPNDKVMFFFLFALVGFIFSLPALIILYFFSFFWLCKLNFTMKAKKTFLSVLAVVSIIITLLFIGGKMIYDVMIAYTVATCISTLLLLLVSYLVPRKNLSDKIG